jgi:hypothetical protein
LTPLVADLWARRITGTIFEPLLRYVPPTAGLGRFALRLAQSWRVPSGLEVRIDRAHVTSPTAIR